MLGLGFVIPCWRPEFQTERFMVLVPFFLGGGVQSYYPSVLIIVTSSMMFM